MAGLLLAGFIALEITSRQLNHTPVQCWRRSRALRKLRAISARTTLNDSPCRRPAANPDWDGCGPAWPAARGQTCLRLELKIIGGSFIAEKLRDV